MSKELKVLKVSKWKKLVFLHETYHVRMLPCGAPCLGCVAVRSEAQPGLGQRQVGSLENGSRMLICVQPCWAAGRPGSGGRLSIPQASGQLCAWQGRARDLSKAPQLDGNAGHGKGLAGLRIHGYTMVNMGSGCLCKCTQDPGHGPHWPTLERHSSLILPMCTP